MLVLGDLQNAAVVGDPIATSCGLAPSNPTIVVHAGDDQSPSVLSGLPAR